MLGCLGNKRNLLLGSVLQMEILGSYPTRQILCMFLENATLRDFTLG
jgi:hypothetical protein